MIFSLNLSTKQLVNADLANNIGNLLNRTLNMLVKYFDGEMKEITVLEQKDSVNYIVKFGNVKCTAIFNWYNCQFYADDKYGIIKEN